MPKQEEKGFLSSALLGPPGSKRRLLLAEADKTLKQVNDQSSTLVLGDESSKRRQAISKAGDTINKASDSVKGALKQSGAKIAENEQVQKAAEGFKKGMVEVQGSVGSALKQLLPAKQEAVPRPRDRQDQGQWKTGDALRLWHRATEGPVETMRIAMQTAEHNRNRQRRADQPLASRYTHNSGRAPFPVGEAAAASFDPQKSKTEGIPPPEYLAFDTTPTGESQRGESQPVGFDSPPVADNRWEEQPANFHPNEEISECAELQTEFPGLSESVVHDGSESQGRMQGLDRKGSTAGSPEWDKTLLKTYDEALEALGGGDLSEVLQLTLQLLPESADSDSADTADTTDRLLDLLEQRAGLKRPADADSAAP